MTLDLTFGALAPPLKRQVGARGLVFPRRMGSLLQREADAISLLHVRGRLTDGEARACRRRLVKEITNQVRSMKVRPAA